MKGLYDKKTMWWGDYMMGELNNKRTIWWKMIENNEAE